MRLITGRDIKAIASYSIYLIAVVLFCIYRCVSRYGDVAYCIQDILCFVEHNSKTMLIPVFMILLFYLNRDFFRTGCIVRFGSTFKWYGFLILKQAAYSAITALIQTTAVLAAGLPFSRLHCTWGLDIGRPYALINRTAQLNVPEAAVPVIFFLCAFMTMFITALIFTAMWAVTEGAAWGYVIAASLAVLERVTRIRLFYGIVDIYDADIYLNGFHIYRYTLFPAVVGVAAAAAAVLLLKRKNFYRFY